ncbi:hypothetical protein DFH07DRAFT_772140 [Mycena maculata]|uniref:Uncharacterized protein n=1 Tax=Mycena maculata TaxID=230809 RepID=A0AAD7NGX8_9AGAR|nr:hypothetical protein DFH07DRAFT_772140 [Mycena maculata]
MPNWEAHPPKDFEGEAWESIGHPIHAGPVHDDLLILFSTYRGPPNGWDGPTSQNAGNMWQRSPARALQLADGKMMVTICHNSSHTGLQLASTRMIESINSMAEPSCKSV